MENIYGDLARIWSGFFGGIHAFVIVRRADLFNRTGTSAFLYLKHAPHFHPPSIHLFPIQR